MTKEEKAPKTPAELREAAAKLRKSVEGKEASDPGVDRALTAAQRLTELADQAELSAREAANYAQGHAEPAAGAAPAPKE